MTEYKSEYNQRAAQAAQLTTQRNNAFEKLQAWISFQRSIEKLRQLYLADKNETRLLDWLNGGHEGAITRRAELEGALAGTDEQLEKLVSQLRDHILDGDAL